MTDYALEIEHIPSEGNGEGSLKARAGEFRAALAEPSLCALLSGGLGGFSRDGGAKYTLHGKPFFPRSPRAALKRGVSVVASESALAPNLNLPDHIRLLPGMLGGRKRAR